MASAEYIATLKDNLSCPLCYDIFDHCEKIPKALPCVHTFCLQCLDTYVQKKLDGQYSCPVCQSTFPVPSDGAKVLPTNTALKNMIDLLQSQTDSTMEQPAKPVCSQHGNKEYLFICQACRVGLCTFCITQLKHGPHCGHDLEDFSKAVDDLRKDAQDRCQELKRCLKNIQDVNDDIVTALYQWKMSLKESASKRANFVIGRVKEWQNLIDKEIDDTHARLLLDTNEQKEYLIEKALNLEPQLHKVSTMCTNFDLDAYTLMKETTPQLKALAIDTQAKFSIKIPDIKFTTNALPPSFGSITSSTGSITLLISDVETFGKCKPEMPVYSQHVYIQKLPWRIMLRLVDEGVGNRYLGIFLECCIDKEMIHVSCKANFEIRLMSKEDYLLRKADNVFCLKQPDWGFKKFITWETFVDPAKGYVKENCATIKVTADAEPPIGL